MGEVNVDDLKEGMVLGRDLLDARGRFLLGQGTVLENKHFRIMKIWGVTAADIEGTSQEEMAQESLDQFNPEILKEANDYVDKLFCNSRQSHEALVELKRLCLIRTAERLAEGLPLIEAKKYEETKPRKEKIISAYDLAEKSVKLSSFPEIYYQIVEVLEDIRSSALRVAEVVSNDTSLSATLLKLVNSAFYGFPKKVDSIARAVALIGGRELTTLALGISVIRYFKDIPPTLVDMRNFWLHSIACGVFARILANRKMELSEEQFFLGGLLHDIGSIVMYNEFPKTMSYVLGVSEQLTLPLYEVEQEVLGYDHARVAGLVLEKWNFPSSLNQMIRHHHSPLGCRSQLEPAILLLANIMATTLGFGDSGSRFAPPFEKKVWQIIGISPSVFSPSIRQADRQVIEILQAFHLDQPGKS